MRKLTSIIALCLLPVLASAQGYSMYIGTSSVKIVPEHPVFGAADWAAGAYAQGQVCKSFNAFYMAVYAGTSTGAPSHATGINSTDDDVPWLHIPKTRRTGTWVTKGGDDSVNLWINFGNTAVVGAGTVLTSLGSWCGVDSGEYSGGVYAIAESGSSNLVSVLCW